MQEPFKYQFPLKHITLNELPAELFPQPMRKLNYDIRELKVLKKEYSQSNQFSYGSTSNDFEAYRNRRTHTEHSQAPKQNRYTRTSLYPNSKVFLSTPGRRKANLHSPSSQMASKTEQLCRMQTESSLQARKMLFSGKSISINMHDASIIDQPKHISAFNGQPSLNDHTTKYINETSNFVKRRENVRDKMRYKLFNFYKQASNQESSHKDYLANQMLKYRQFVVVPPEDELTQEQKRFILIQQNRSMSKKKQLKQPLSLPPTVKRKERNPSLYHPSQELLKRARRLKTEEHHRIITRINAKTNELLEQWNSFSHDETSQAIGQRVRNRQIKILNQNKDLNKEAQNHLKGDLGQILKMFQFNDQTD